MLTGRYIKDNCCNVFGCRETMISKLEEMPEKILTDFIEFVTKEDKTMYLRLQFALQHYLDKVNKHE